MRMSAVTAALSVAAVLAFVTPLVVAAQAPDLAGSWTLSWETPRGDRTLHLTLVQTEASFTGTAALPRGEAPVKDGVIDGETVTFVVEIAMARPGGNRSRTVTQRFEGVLKDGVIEGEVRMEGMGGPGGGEGERTFPFTMRRPQG